MRAVLATLALALGAGAAAVCLLAPGYYGYLLGTLATTALAGIGLNILLGLAPAVAAELFGQFAQLREEGVTLLIVDQMADHVLAVADRGYVLGGGRMVAQGAASELRDKMLDDAYLGAHPAAVS
jgi:MFS family permease